MFPNILVPDLFSGHDPHGSPSSHHAYLIVRVPRADVGHRPRQHSRRKPRIHRCGAAPCQRNQFRLHVERVLHMLLGHTGRRLRRDPSYLQCG